MISEIRNKIRSGKATIGSWMQIPSGSVAEILGKSGYDWVAVDLEHGQFSRAELPLIFRAIEVGGATPFARVSDCSQSEIKHALDSGAKGIILPMIESGEALKEAIDHIFFPPKGKRGIGYSRANLFGKHFYEYLENESNETVIVAQIENIQAVNNLDAILSVDQLDAIMVGPYDLSGSLGVTGQFQSQAFTEAMNAIDLKAKEHGIPMGLHIVQPDEELLKKKIEEGYKFIAYGIDAVFLYNTAVNPLSI